MMKRILIPAMILAILMLCAACDTQPAETTLPVSTETITVPTEQTAVPTTKPVTEATTVPPHIHQIGVEGIRGLDYAGHQYRCSCKEIITEPHIFDEEGACTVCAGYVRREENGEYVLTTYHDKVGFVSAEWFYKPIESGSDSFYQK